MSEHRVLPFTSRTYVSLAIARGIAAAYGHEDLSATHVALGFLREAENPAVAALQRAGVDLRKLRHDLEAELPGRGRTRMGKIALPTTAGEEAVIALAARESASRDAEYLGNEHLLLALLRDPGTDTARVFERHGFSYETAVAQLKLVFDPGR